MGSCWSCCYRDTFLDNHPTKFKVTNVDDEGNELGSGIMELTQTELILHTQKRDAVRWPYLCLRRYGYDSNLFSFESGRRCQTGQGIFAFKCLRAEEIFNLLQELMQCNSINVVEEPVLMTRSTHPTELDLPRTPQTPNTPAYTMLGFPNGFPGYPIPGEGSSHSSTRHPSVGSMRHSSVGEESTHALIGGEDQAHTYVNTANVDEEMRSRRCLHTLPEVRPSFPESARHHGAHCCSLEERNPKVFLQPGEVKFVLGPTPAQRRLMEREGLVRFQREHQDCGGHICGSERETCHNNNDHKEPCHAGRLTYENINGLLPPGNAVGLRRGGPALNNCSYRKTALLNYENLPALPPVWECQPLRREEEEEEEEEYDEEDCEDPMTPSLNSYHHDPDPLRNYVNTENVTLQPSLHKADFTRRQDCTPNVFSFDFQRPHPEPRHLNYIQVELEGGGGGGGGPHNPQTPRAPCPVPPTPSRHSDFYAVIDIKRTTAMSSLQRALPREDGTSRKTRHNSTDLPL
ncbi:fibroblast growth factor receptor substrate 2 [Latimeria chalumnae]|uniref:Fibroblast growth factor receptor substrate 3 n=1 Tax=Latimeria chalumnae TaxID=7897 RepID=H3B1T4_LATCH|nr:PREDICTED: fibroblast growth factor receptor substrate 3 [Latimeria chalumnae]XP_014347679.1 PREDICTED: fibroblast growth factor receptor substrate 3 [Latimeria chalumnae]|eukprot:XP_006002345.1 PREDICTED: fibroblast growth factor receptor substrate 3 [Latimeria chalumnae]